MTKGKALYDESIVIDACAPLACPYEGEYLNYQRYIAGGQTMICATIMPINGYLPETIGNILNYNKLFRSDPRVKKILTVKDIYDAKKNGQLGMMLSFQGCTHLQNDLGLIEIYHQLGVRQMMLCYNIKNCMGDGCAEPGDGGLSTFGEQAIKRMNQLGIVVDLAHTGYRTTMEAMEVCEKPPVFSHGNSRSVWDNPRNLCDDQVKRVAELGGVVGVNGYPSFISEKTHPTMDDFLAHLDYYVQLVGIDHVCFGVDYYQGQAGIMDDEKATMLYYMLVASGTWNEKAYGKPPYYYPQDIEIPEKFFNIVDALLARGYSESDIQKMLGGNYIRVLREVFNEPEEK